MDIKPKNVKMFLGEEEINGFDNWNIESFEPIEIGTFSGTFNNGCFDEQAFKELIPKQPHEMKFYYYEEGFGRYWNNILFRIFYGPAEKKKSVINFKGLFSDIRTNEKNGKTSISIEGKVIY